MLCASARNIPSLAALRNSEPLANTGKTTYVHGFRTESDGPHLLLTDPKFHRLRTVSVHLSTVSVHHGTTKHVLKQRKYNVKKFNGVCLVKA